MKNVKKDRKKYRKMCYIITEVKTDEKNGFSNGKTGTCKAG